MTMMSTCRCLAARAARTVRAVPDQPAGVRRQIPRSADGGAWRRPVAAFQLRVKDVDSHELARLAEPLQRICADAGTAFIVNDSMSLAKRLARRGPPRPERRRRARGARFARPGVQIGVTCHDSRHLRWRRGSGADYSRSALSMRPDQAQRLPARAGAAVMVVGIVRNPVRRDRRDHARQRPPAGRRRRRLRRRVPGGVGPGRPRASGRGVRRGAQRLAATERPPWPESFRAEGE